MDTSLLPQPLLLLLNGLLNEVARMTGMEEMREPSNVDFYSAEPTRLQPPLSAPSASHRDQTPVPRVMHSASGSRLTGPGHHRSGSMSFILEQTPNMDTDLPSPPATLLSQPPSVVLHRAPLPKDLTSQQARLQASALSTVLAILRPLAPYKGKVAPARRQCPAGLGPGSRESVCVLNQHVVLGRCSHSQD